MGVLISGCHSLVADVDVKPVVDYCKIISGSNSKIEVAISGRLMFNSGILELNVVDNNVSSQSIDLVVQDNDKYNFLQDHVHFYRTSKVVSIKPGDVYFFNETLKGYIDYKLAGDVDDLMMSVSVNVLDDRRNIVKSTPVSFFLSSCG